LQIETPPVSARVPLHLSGYLEDARRRAVAQIGEWVAARNERYRPILYDLMLEYPIRQGKGLRPALCIAACGAAGGAFDAVLPTAAVFELYHNAFLIHDDVEDASELRRGSPTLHRTHGVAVAMNTGDAMLALALRPLIKNVELLGLGKTLAILEAVARMAEETAEGQSLELHWIRQCSWDIEDDDYVAMVTKKTAWYSFITPLLAGGIAAGAKDALLASFEEFGRLLGIAFQIQDDLLNLTARQDAYGKEREGDLWEGKFTLVLLQALRRAGDIDRARALAMLGKRRSEKTQEDVAFLKDVVRKTGALETAQATAWEFIHRTEAAYRCLEEQLCPSVHRHFLGDLVRYVVERDR
jgi:geranylgeranyl diphosphate synthase type II